MMGRMLDTVAEMLDAQDWNYTRAEKRDAIFTSVTGSSSTYRIVFDIKETAEQCVLYVISPTKVAEDKRLAACEFLTRANYGLLIGSFEQDMSDGEIRFKVSVDVEGSKLVPKMTRNMLGCGVAMMERYYPGIMAVAFGGVTAEKAVADCEAS